MKKKVITKQNLERIQSQIDRQELLNAVGADKVHSDSEGVVRGTCPIHKGDNPTAIAVFPDNNWCCFTRDCSEGKRQDLISLVQKSLGKSFIDSVSFLACMAGIKLEFSEEEINEDIIKSSSWSNLCNNNTKDKKLEISKYTVREFISNRIDYLHQRGIDNDTQNEFEIGFTDSWKGYNEKRVTFPIVSEGTYVGIQGRAIHGDSRDGPNPYPRKKKYDNYSKFSKSNFLYNFDRARSYSVNTGRIIIVEGITDVMKLYQYGIRDVVSCLGSSISDEHFNLLSSGYWKVFIMFDNDEGGQKGKKKFLSRYGNYFDLYFPKLPDGKDPADMDFISIYSALNRTKKYEI